MNECSVCGRALGQSYVKVTAEGERALYACKDKDCLGTACFVFFSIAWKKPITVEKIKDHGPF